MIEPRIIPRTELGPVLTVAKSTSARYTCKHTIKLGRKRYRCGREVIGIDRDHGGIHDAFAEHEGGSVRW